MELRTGLAGLIATSIAASVWLRGMLALSTERENNEGSGNGDASVRKIDFFFFFELGVYCPLHKQQDMMVQLSITSYGYHLVTQEEVNNRLSSWL